MIKKFTRNNLLRLNLSTEKIQVILDFQEKLPILLESNDTWIDSRRLWEQLTVKKQYTDWINEQISALDLVKNTDFMLFSLQSEIGNSGNFREDIGYKITICSAKDISMIAGIKGGRTSENLKKMSKLARHYFIYMEEALRENFDYDSIRIPEREGFNIMCDELDKHLQKIKNRSIDKWDRIYESNAINIIATGFEAKDIRLHIGCKDNQTREYLDKVYNEYISTLQEFNTQMIMADVEKYNRYVAMSNYFNSKFPDATLIKDNVTINKINENRKKLLQETYEKTSRAA